MSLGEDAKQKALLERMKANIENGKLTFSNESDKKKALAAVNEELEEIKVDFAQTLEHMNMDDYLNRR